MTRCNVLVAAAAAAAGGADSSGRRSFLPSTAQPPGSAAGGPGAGLGAAAGLGAPPRAPSPAPAPPARTMRAALPPARLLPLLLLLALLPLLPTPGAAAAPASRPPALPPAAAGPSVSLYLSEDEVRRLIGEWGRLRQGGQVGPGPGASGPVRALWTAGGSVPAPGSPPGPGVCLLCWPGGVVPARLPPTPGQPSGLLPKPPKDPGTPRPPASFSIPACLQPLRPFALFPRGTLPRRSKFL